jgi:hypothetical protein
MLWVVVVAAGCTQSPEERVQTVCNAVCDCTVTGGLPSAIQTCITSQCEPTLTPMISDDCLQCVFDHEGTCTDLETDCTTLCFMQQTD